MIRISSVTSLKPAAFYTEYDKEYQVSLRYYINSKSGTAQFEHVALDKMLAERLKSAGPVQKGHWRPREDGKRQDFLGHRCVNLKPEC